MWHILGILLILASVQMSFGQLPESPSAAAQAASSANESEAEKVAKQEHIAQLFQRIQELKAANQYDEALWREYLGLTEEEAPPISRLDQGGSTCETATVIPYLPCGDMGTLDPDWNDDCPGRPYQDVFYRYTAVENGIHLFHMCDAQSAGDTYFRVWLDGACCSGSYADADDNCYGGGLDGMVFLNLTVGQIIYIECGYYYTTGGTTYALLGVGPGFDCWNPIPISLPSQLPYSNTNTTCGKINYYTETCLGNYDEGQDIFYQLYVFAPMIVDFGLTSNASWVGMCIDENCPPSSSCINMCTSSGSSCSMLGVSLSAGTYYLMIDTWPDPDCIPQFTLNITPACPQLSGPLWGTLVSQLYCVVGDIWVNSGDLLTLQPGTTFRFDGPYSFRILGTLSAIGTASDSIVFTTEQTGSNRWRGLRFEGSGSSGSQLACCLIEKGYATGTWPNDCGGGVYCQESSPTFTNCSIRDNSAVYGGGGVFCVQYSNARFTNCSISGNSAGLGGGIYCYYFSSPTFAHCTLSDNSASYGGGVYFDNSSFTVKSTVIAFSTGSGIFFTASSGSQVGYCDIYGNSGGNFQFWSDDPANGPSGIGQLTTSNANGDPCDPYYNIFLDPLFANWLSGDFHLTDASHCIGAANPWNPPPVDFEGDPRPNPPGTNPDIGIDEHWLGCPVGRLVITMASGNAVLYWPYFAYTVNIYGATAPYTAGTLITTVYGVTTWTDFQTSSRPSPYFYYVKAAQ